jgi:hypothetical protein
LGAGTPFGNGGDNFDWMDSWSISKKGKVNGTPTLIGDALLVEKMDSASAIVFWDGKEYQGINKGINSQLSSGAAEALRPADELDG